ncbi:MAG: DsbA family protein [Bosea sp. (in: a-proteobacteria)]
MLASHRRTFLQRAALGLAGVASAPVLALAQADSWFDIAADDGKPVSNSRLPVELTSEIETLPGVIWAGSSSKAVTLFEFYDFNCPYCRVASGDLHTLMAAHPELRIGLVNNAILSPGSVQAARIEAALLVLKGPEAAYDFHRRLFAMPGRADGARALKLGEGLGVARAELEAVADSERIGKMVSAQRNLAANLGLAATPSFVAGGAGLLGYPGPKSLARIVTALDECGEVVCRP